MAAPWAAVFVVQSWTCPASVHIGGSSFDDTLRVVAMGIVLTFLATLYPVFRVARLDPVKALRYE
jgi:hypothetical protein